MKNHKLDFVQKEKHLFGHAGRAGRARRSGGSVRVGVRVGHVGRASRVGESWCVIIVSSIGSPHLQAQILLPTAMPNMSAPDWATRGPQRIVRTAGVSAADSVASSDSPVPPGGKWVDFEFRIGQLSVTGLASRDTVNTLRDAARESPSSFASYRSGSTPKSEAKVAAKGKRKRKTSGKSKPKGVTKVALKPQHATTNDAEKLGPLPECPGTIKSPPIEYGICTVYFSPASKAWRVKPATGSRITHAVKWGEGKKITRNSGRRLRSGCANTIKLPDYGQVSVLLPDTCGDYSASWVWEAFGLPPSWEKRQHIGITLAENIHTRPLPSGSKYGPGVYAPMLKLRSWSLAQKPNHGTETYP